MTPRQKLEVRQSERRQRLNELAGLDKIEDAQRTELDTLTVEFADGERQFRAAVLAEDTDAQTDAAAAAAAGDPLDSAELERRALRARCNVGPYIVAALSGSDVTGAELELRHAAGLAAGQIPIEVFDTPRETRAESLAPATGTGVNVDLIKPMIFANSIADRVGVAMPRVGSGTYSTMTISTSTSAEAVAPGAAAQVTAGVLTPQTTTAHRVSARLSLRIEDIQTVGAGNFETVLRQNLTLAMSAQLDAYLLNGSGAGVVPEGLLHGLDDPTDPTAVATWDDFVAALVDGIDGGPWAETASDVKLIVNAETMRLAEKTFTPTVGDATKGIASQSPMSAARYLREHTGGIIGHSRMPATASTIAECLRYRNHTMGLDGVNAMRTAVCPTWADLSITDIYTDSAKAITHFTIHALIGDVIREQPTAYERVDLKVSA